MSSIAGRMAAIAAELPQHENLPMGSLSVGVAFARIVVPSYYTSRNWAGLREVIQWASAFDTEIIISLSGYGNGTAETTVELGGVHVSVEESVGSSLAYELGRILQRELNRDVSIHIGADELLAAIDQVVAS